MIMVTLYCKNIVSVYGGTAMVTNTQPIALHVMEIFDLSAI